MTTCVWCGSPFGPRTTGGKPQRFCGESCRREFWQKLRAWALLAVDTGLLPVEALKRVTARRASSTGRLQAETDRPDCRPGISRPPRQRRLAS